MDGANEKQVNGDGMKPRAITPEMLEAGKSVIQMIRYQIEHTPIPADYDAEGRARAIFAAPDSPAKRAFLRMARRIARSGRSREGRRGGWALQPIRSLRRAL